jgi:CheY-like chemotaxis protein/AraC-like DNA-binding protein/anti-sigma regulatory factor (Ser/Thr protein kinase)
VKVAHIESEKEKELHEKKLSFFTNISHEFRTPLTLIINLIKDIHYSGAGNVDPQDLNTINRNAKRLLSLVDQLLLFRRADAGAEELKITRVDVNSLCKEVYLCFIHQAKTKQIELAYEAADDTVEIFGDREKIEIVVFNLVANAIKFTDNGGRIALKIAQDEQGVEITVEDTGCGIPDSAGDKLFNKFYQEYNFDQPTKGGLGIGLYLVKNYVEALGGEISYVSQVNEGTTFRLRFLKGTDHFAGQYISDAAADGSVLLMEIIEDKLEEISAEIKKEDIPDGTILSEKKAMLIIEDNREICDYIKQVFKADYSVYEAADGDQGLKMVSELMPDIVISDVMMPGIDGIELCRRIKENPELNHIPVILLTASTSPEVRLKGIEGGADDYVNKPFEKDILVARVKGILKTRNNLQKYFFNEITLNKSNNLKISQEYKDFLQRCIAIVEAHINDPEFSIKTIADEIGMSHSNLYRKIKSISGQSATAFIRFIRLRKAAEILLTTDSTVYQAAYSVGLTDLKYFREQFSKLFGLNPSEYIKKFRTPFHKDKNVIRHTVKGN